MISPDLRNPLDVAASRLELASDDHDSAHLEHAATAVRRSLSLIDDLRTYAAERAAAIDPEPVALGATAADGWGTVPTNDATLAVETDRTIRADPRALRLAFENLLSNAVTHAGEDAAVTVGSLVGGFYVADDGPGIPADRRETVFEAGHSTGEDGTGFGLAIVEAIADAHGWTISVAESEAGGARFEFTGVDILEA